MLNENQIVACLAHLRRADEILLEHDEMALAVHLSLVIERLSERLGQG